MKITIGKYDPETRSVPVTFKQDAITHKRRVNVVLDADGAYDRAATKVRVDEVGNGVAAKIAVGAITA